MKYSFRPIQTDNDSIQQITGLLQTTFPKAVKYTESFVRWQYADNPAGQMIGFNAFLEDELAAHYALMPITSMVFGKEEKGLLSLNTATHPEHRGNRLFPTLAAKSYEQAADLGYSFVIGVANAQSTPGFIKRLDFQLVGRLDAKLGYGKLKRSTKNVEIDYQRVWSEELIQWRLSNPSLDYKVQNKRVLCSTDQVGIQAILKDFESNYRVEDKKRALGFRPINLWIGIDHSIHWKKSFYFDIPMRLRPSPLNLIFKDLSGSNRKFDFSAVKFSALDFDAY